MFVVEFVLYRPFSYGALKLDHIYFVCNICLFIFHYVQKMRSAIGFVSSKQAPLIAKVYCQNS